MSEIIYKKYEPLFGSWNISREIGHGAIGKVYELSREELGETYTAALKVVTIPSDPGEIDKVVFGGVPRNFLENYYHDMMVGIVDELKHLNRLKGHANIMSYEDHQVIKHDDGIGWDILIKTEMLQSLVDYSNDNPLGEDEIIKLGVDISRAISFCSKHGIIHRDIKPDNIYVSASGDFKLGDFGIATFVEETQYDMSRKGTYSYMAPEVFHGDNYGTMVDIYSLGLVMYKLLNYGRNPFMPRYPEVVKPGDIETAFTRRMCTENVPNPIRGSKELRQIVLKACAFKTEDRYQTADEMCHDLEMLMYARRQKQEAGLTLEDFMKEIAVPEPKYMDRKTLLLHRIIPAAAILAAIAGICAYMIIPKAVEDITGLDGEIELYYDEPLKLECAAAPDWFKDEPIAYESSDEGIFTVSEEGEIIPAKIGEATLTASAKEYSETSTINVIPKVSSIEGLDDTYYLTTGQSLELKPVLKPEKFGDEQITYTSSEESVALISKAGKVTSIAAGETEVSIAAGGSVRKIKIAVTNPAPVVQSTKKNSSKKNGSSSGTFKNGNDLYF